MEKLDIEFVKQISASDGITITDGDNQMTLVSVAEDEVGFGKFYTGANAQETATNVAEAINTYNASTHILGTIATSVDNDTVSVTFVDESVTSPSVSSFGANNITVTSSSVSSETYNYDKQILTRSPHFFEVGSVNNENIQSAELHIYVYQGSRYTDRPDVPTYVVRSSAVLSDSKTMSFNISEFARDFAEGTLAKSGLEANWNPFVDIFPYYRQNNSSFSLQPVFGVAYNGYGYYTEGVNPTNESPIAQSNRIIIAPDDHLFSLPINADKASKVVFEKDGEVTAIENIPNNITFSTVALPAVGNGYLGPEGDAVNSESDYFENRYFSEYLNDYSNTQADKIYVEGTDGNTETIEVRYIKECKYEPVRLAFVNKFGAIQSVWFFKNNSTSIKVDQDSFRRNTLSSGAYDIPHHQHKNLYKTGKESITLNSGFYPEEYNEVFKQMMLSVDVWINYDNRVIPVNISDSSMDFKTGINEKLIEYSVKCDFAFDTINSIN